MGVVRIGALPPQHSGLPSLSSWDRSSACLVRQLEPRMHGALLVFALYLKTAYTSPLAIRAHGSCGQIPTRKETPPPPPPPPARSEKPTKTPKAIALLNHQRRPREARKTRTNAAVGLAVGPLRAQILSVPRECNEIPAMYNGHLAGHGRPKRAVGPVQRQQAPPPGLHGDLGGEGGLLFLFAFPLPLAAAFFCGIGIPRGV